MVLSVTVKDGFKVGDCGGGFKATSGLVWLQAVTVNKKNRTLNFLKAKEASKK
jgi:hypothetical protein